MENNLNHDSNNTENEVKKQDENEVIVPENITPDTTTEAAEAVSEKIDNLEEASMETIMDAMDQLYEDSFKAFSEGEVLKGIVVQVDKEHVMLDVGGKSEGRILRSEFEDENGNITIKVGDEVEALLVRWDRDEGDIILSKDKAERIKIWDDIIKIHDNDETIVGKVIARVKGGLSVDIGVNAFLPGSQVDIRPIKNLEALVGENFDFKVLKFNKRRGNVVLSRRAILEAEREDARDETLKTLEANAVVEGIVKNLTDYGAFVDLGGLDGLLHITDMSWGRLSHPSEMFSVGDNIKVKILEFDKESLKVSLGHKQLEEDPWLNVAQHYTVTTRVTGKVVSLADYGAFIELEKGIEGLIHVSEMSWTRKIRNPGSILKIGDIVECVILNLDVDAKRISLGMKQIEENPWDTVAERFPIGTIIEGNIKNITDFGVFIGIDEGIDGLVHISDISWVKRYKHPSEVFKKGDSVRALILDIDRDQERFSLGIKQLEEDPWSLAVTKFPVGETCTGRITNITDFGLFVELSEGVEGLVHISESGLAKGQNLSDAFKIEDQIITKVISVSATEHKIGLSLRKLKEDEEKSLYTNYSSTSKKEEKTSANAPAKANEGDSPFSNLGQQLSQALASQVAKDESADKIEDNIADKTEDKIEDNIADKTEDKIEDNIEDKIEDSIEDKTEDKIEDSIEDKTEDKIEDNIADKTEDKIEIEIESEDTEN